MLEGAIHDPHHLINRAVGVAEPSPLVTQRAPLLAFGSICFNAPTVASLRRLERHAATLTLFHERHSHAILVWETLTVVPRQIEAVAQCPDNLQDLSKRIDDA